MPSNLSSGWRPCELGEVAELLFSGVDKKIVSSEVAVRLCNYTDVYYHRRLSHGINFREGSATEREIAQFYLRKGDVVITKDSETPDDIAVPALVTETMPDVVCGYHLAIVRPRQGILDGAYLAELFQFQPMRRYFSKLANGVTRFGLSTIALRRALLLLPPVDEQKVIAASLDIWNRGIDAIERTIKLKRRWRQGLLQHLFSGEARFNGYSESPHQPVQLKEVFEKVADPVTPIAGEMYQQIGVRSHGKGIFHKPLASGQSLGNKRVFRVIPDCLTLNIIFAWERALAVTTAHEQGMIASHRFPMFRPDAALLLPEYALLYLLSKKGAEALKLASPGGAGRNRTLNQTEFLRIEMPLPSIAEQRQIVSLIRAIDRQIRLLGEQLNALRHQKKGLMQKLLNGQVRLKNLECDAPIAFVAKSSKKRRINERP